MKTLQQHNEEMEKEFDEKFVEMHFCIEPILYSMKFEEIARIKNFITNSNKQLYIKIAEGEIERLKNSFEEYTRTYPEPIYYQDRLAEIVNARVRSEINYWNDILQELNK